MPKIAHAYRVKRDASDATAIGPLSVSQSPETVRNALQQAVPYVYLAVATELERASNWRTNAQDPVSASDDDDCNARA